MKTVISRTIQKTRLYHISFDDKLEGMWIPQLPAGTELGDGVYPEPKIPRISVAPTLEACFYGVYPNVRKFFDVNKYPSMTFAVYSPVFVGTERVVLPDVLTKEKLVWDAHVTKEHLILDKVSMVKIGEVTFINPDTTSMKEIHPFGDTRLPLTAIGPTLVKHTFERGNT